MLLSRFARYLPRGKRKLKQHTERLSLVLRKRNGWVLALAMLPAAGCARAPAMPPSDAHIGALTQPAAKPSDIPQPVRTAPFVPPPKPVARPQTYSVVVNEVPVKELLFALARDAGRNVDIHPGIHGLVTLNAINETLPAILERVARQVNIRYRADGDTLTVMPDTPYLKTYPVNYVNVARNTTSSIGVATQIASTGTSSAGQSAAAGNSSTTTVNSTSNNNFWEVLAENIRNIISSTKAAALGAEEKTARMEAARTAREERLQQVEAVARAGAGAPNLFTTAFGAPAQTPADDAKHAVIVNPVAGSVTVLGTERQQELVRQYLDGITGATQRQVLIEATIVEVTLSDKYKSGVDWSRLANGVGFTIRQELLGGNLAAAPRFTVGYANPNSSVGNISAAITLLESFGNIRVLSSPKLMALNNQTALLKVVDEKVYFTTQLDVREATTTTPEKRTYTSTLHTVPVGMVMSVTPQIGSDERVSLTVRPTISRITGFMVDPAPRLAGSSFDNLIPEIQVREMESVLQVASGQTVILGGLMQDDATRNRDGVAGLARLPTLGDAFSYRDESVAKTELVIFLRPTTIANASLESDELKLFRRYLPANSAADLPHTAEHP